MGKTVFITAGERSGDAYGALLASALRRHLGDDVCLRGVGSDQMAAAGVELIGDISPLAAIGGIEAFRSSVGRLISLARLSRRITREIPRTDAAVLIDCPGLNLAVMKRMRKAGVPVVYFVPPHAWAWGDYQGRAIARWGAVVASTMDVDDAYYRRKGCVVERVGHPLLDVIADRGGSGPDPGPDPEPHVLLLPGSRGHEVAAHTPVLISAATAIRAARPDVAFSLSSAGPRYDALVQQACREASFPVEFVSGLDYQRARRAAAVLCACGTVTLEIALLGVPLVVLYKLRHTVDRLLFEAFNKTPFFSLPNIILQEGRVPEIYLNQVGDGPIAAHALELLNDPEARPRAQVLREQLWAKLGGPGATEAVAQMVVRELESTRGQTPSGR